MDVLDRCFYISISSEEDSHIKAYKKPKEHLSLFKGSFKGKTDSFITASSVALELKAEPVESSKQLFVYARICMCHSSAIHPRLSLCHSQSPTTLTLT